MNVLQNLMELANSQSTESIYRNLAKEILENLDHMKRVTIYDISDLTNSSRTTIWRLVQKLGYPSFSDFRYALQSAANQYTYYNRLIEAKYAETSDMLLKKTADEMKSSAKILRDCVTPELVEELTDELYKAQKVRFYTPFRMASIYSLQINLDKCGKDTGYYCLLPDMLEDAKKLNEESIVMINTLEYAETLNMTDVFDMIKKKGAKIWLAGESSTQFAHYANRRIMNLSSSPVSWMYAFESMMIVLSERFRNKFLD